MAALSLTLLTPKRQAQHQLSFDTASLDGSPSPAQAGITSSSPRDHRSRSKFTFTPQRTKTVPRAWERRPATPYLARNEAQKIWKRVPLSSITANAGDSWNKADRARASRPVKKLRIAEDVLGEDKENINYIASKWDEDRRDAHSPKRKIAGFTAINNRDGKTAYEARVNAVMIGDLPSGVLSNLDSPDSDLSADEKPENVDGVVDHSTLEHATCSETGEMDLLVEEEDDVSQDSQSADEAMSDGVNAEDETVIDHPATMEEAEPPITLNTPEALMPQATAGTKVAIPAGEDETAFLHDFLSRARAQKAARQQPEQQSTGDELVQHLPEVENVGEDISEQASPVKNTGDIDGPGFHAESDGTILQPDAQPEAEQLSPCRRSSRLITRLPRPQKQITALPSSIALRRLTGAEFISQKETQSVALTTRTNTKRNKGVAITPKQRLMQLTAEAIANPSTALTENAKKKRKRAKEVTWAEQLTRFQTHTPVLRSMEGDEPDELESPVAPDTVEKEEVLPVRSLEPEETATEKEKKQVRKVRKLRKLNVGTCNGTPAPKKTISLPVPVASAFFIESSKSTSSVANNELAMGSTVQLEGKKGPMTASGPTKTSIPGSETRLQPRMRTRNKTSLAAPTLMR